ncbi:MAG: hypothetical protein MNPFHGCM_02079 [Gemmatimonadaceae bacterium]|nr:hypothetical protein [Gemmatimonadaceae bacterium]
MHAPDATTARPARPADVLWLALATAGIAVVAHVSAVAIRRHALHQFTWTTSDLPWMSLVGNTIVFLGMAVAVWVLGIVVARLRRLSAVVAIFGCLAALCVLLLVTGIWQYASLAFALGLATVLSRAARDEPDSFLRYTRRVALATLAVGAAMAGRALQSDGSPPGSASGASGMPNVLLIIFDTVRASSTSLHGYSLRTTPVLDKLARESVVFDRAVATAPWTLPSHCSFFTGRDAQDTSCRWAAPLDSEGTTIAEVLRDRGYRTGAFVANVFYTTRETGLARGFDTWMDFRRTWKEVFCSTVIAQTGIVRNAVWGGSLRERISGLVRLRLRGDPKPEHDRKRAEIVNADLLKWVDEDSGRPFFAFLNYFDAHDPYRAPPPYDRAFPTAPHSREQYDGAIAYMDAQLGKLLSELRRRGLLDRTIVVVASDHGEMFGEHELYGHGNSVYWPLLHVPLVLRYPAELASGVRVSTAVSLKDLPATLLDLAGADDLRIGGVSLANLVRDSSAVRPSAALSFVEQGRNWWANEPARVDSLRSIVVGSEQYVHAYGGREQLFDLAKDVHGLRDVAADHADRLPAMREALERAVARPTVARPPRAAQ